ncbi:YdaS family helix-turn-helix protein [Caballeronia sp. dw_19]|uniref:transcriptional regulator n=1 Tax=Caballeronia sp. dw_19 TaxID=2719791 RepID=UPI001BCB95B6|nr:YdaS family helix-turn-helix protein [Caballeronia sp. dw_19]
MNLKTYINSGKRGTAKDLAKRLGVSPSYLSQMASGLAPISPERAVRLEEETHGAVARRDTFPDNWRRIWPEIAGPEGCLASRATEAA